MALTSRRLAHGRDGAGAALSACLRLAGRQLQGATQQDRAARAFDFGVGVGAGGLFALHLQVGDMVKAASVVLERMG